MLEREADLAGLPASDRGDKAAAAERNLDGKWAIVNTRSSVDPFLTCSTRPDLRERVWRKFKCRGDNGDANDTNATIVRMVKLRADRARLLGYPSHAHWRMADTMAKDPEAALALLTQVWTAAVARVKREVADMQAIAARETGAHYDRAVGLLVLRGEGQEGTVRPRSKRLEAVFRSEPDGRCSVMDGGAAVRPRVQRDHRHGPGVSPGGACVGSHGRDATQPRVVLSRHLRAAGQALRRVDVELPGAAQVPRSGRSHYLEQQQLRQAAPRSACCSVSPPAG